MTWPAEVCGYGCGKPWFRWAGSRLKGHARCAATPEMLADLLAVYERFPLLSLGRMASDFGVSYAVMRGWIRRAQRLAGRPG